MVFIRSFQSSPVLSAHCILTSNALTVMDENHECCIFLASQCSAILYINMNEKFGSKRDCYSGNKITPNLTGRRTLAKRRNKHRLIQLLKRCHDKPLIYLTNIILKSTNDTNNTQQTSSLQKTRTQVSLLCNHLFFSSTMRL